MFQVYGISLFSSFAEICFLMGCQDSTLSWVLLGNGEIENKCGIYCGLKIDWESRNLEYACTARRDRWRYIWRITRTKYRPSNLRRRNRLEGWVCRGIYTESSFQYYSSTWNITGSPGLTSIILASQGLSTPWHRVLRPWLARMTSIYMTRWSCKRNATEA